MKFMNKTNERKKCIEKQPGWTKNESHVLITYLCAGVPNASVHFFENKHTVNHKIDEIYFFKISEGIFIPFSKKCAKSLTFAL